MAGLLVAGACSAGPATAPTVTTAATGSVTPEGFAATRARVTAADGEVCELCVWVADTTERRARGLMGVTDLGAAEAMAFVYPGPTSTAFWMFSTPMPLSIAFFDPVGTWLDDFDMTPCADHPCASYATPDGFSVALEVPAGGLADLLVGPGSTFALLDLPCEPGG